MGGSTKSISSTPNDIQGLRTSMVNWLMQGPQGTSQQPGSQLNSNIPGGLNPPTPTTYGMAQAPTTQQFAGQAQGGYSAQAMPNNGMVGQESRSSGFNPGMGPKPLDTGIYGSQFGQTGMGQNSNIPNINAPYDPRGNANSGPNMFQAFQSAGGNSGSAQGQGSYDAQQAMMGRPQMAPQATGSPSPYTQAPGSNVDWSKNAPGGVTSGPPNPAFNQIFNQGPQGGPAQSQQVTLPGAPGQIDPSMVGIGSYGQMQGALPFNLQAILQNQIAPGVGDPSGAYMGVNAQTNGLIPQSQFNRGQVRDAAASSSGYNPTQSVDRLGGANSAFFRNMQAQLQPAFSQGRAEALAAAKEGLGNMGSGTALANSLGTAMNRSLGNEQATLANYATQGIQTEVGRQLGDAAQQAQVGMANANRDLSAQQGNQGADISFLNSLLGQGSLGAQLSGQNLQGQIANQGTSAQLGIAGANNALQGALANQNNAFNTQNQNVQNQMGVWNAQNQFNQNAQQGNMGANLQAMLANQGASNAAQGQNIANQMNQGQFNANLTQNNNQFNAQMGQVYQQLVAQMGQQNAANYLAMLMGMGTTGVQGNQVVQSGGMGSLLGPIGSAVGSYFGSRASGGK